MSYLQKIKDQKNKKNKLQRFFMNRPISVSVLFLLNVWMMSTWIVYRFESDVPEGNIKTFGDAIWWSVVTILTVGYGDRYPVTTEGRTAAVIMMICGVAATGVLTAKLSSVFLEKALQDRRGYVDTEQLKNHFVICGWKVEMHSLLLNIINANSGLKAQDIIIICNVPDEDIQTIHEFPKLKNIKFIKGDFFSIEILKRAAPQKARKILVVADATPNSRGQIPTITEADARTIMTAMTLSNIAKGVPVAAEILDSEMDQYLRLANVHEIIYSRDYSRFLLALSSSGNGVTNIFHDLLDPKSNYCIKTYEVSDEEKDRTYRNIRQRFEENKPFCTVIGILENSGNSHRAKEAALKKAQQTPNIQELVRNLQNVKHLRFNEPVFGPPGEYQLKDESMLIVIEFRGLSV